jgi:F0F1-type ATP synthase epsilon subunit
MYAHRYHTQTEYDVIHYFVGGERTVAHDQHDYLAWLAEGNTPTIEAGGRFLSIVGGALVVDPDMNTILAAEAAARQADVARIAAKEQAIVDNLPSWTEVDTAITNANTNAAMKIIISKLARVVYWLAKNKAD